MIQSNDVFRKALRGRLIAALVCSVALPAGVVMTVFGGINEIWALLAVGIVLTVAGFYGTPLLWVRYGALNSYKGVYGLIACDGVTSVSKIASTLGWKRNKAVAGLNYLLAKRYLAGYVYDGADSVTPIEKKSTPDLFGKCPNCGASLTAEQGKLRCPYCGAAFGNK